MKANRRERDAHAEYGNLSKVPAMRVVVDGFGVAYGGEATAVFGRGRGRRFWVLWFHLELNLALTGRTRSYVGSTSGKRNLPSKAIRDEVFSPAEGLINGKVHHNYFNLASQGQGVNARHTNRLKIWTINLEGRFNVRHVDQTMAEDPSQGVELTNIEGYVGFFVILDRMPVPTALPTFSDVFGELPNSDSSRLDQHVRLDQLSRFKVLTRERRYVNDALSGSMFTFKRFLKLNGRNRFITTFKDMGTNTSGRYGNVRDNAIFMPGNSSGLCLPVVSIVLLVLHSCGCFVARATWEQSTSSSLNSLDLILKDGGRNSISSGLFDVHSLTYALILQ
ncbi:hypothetical protein C3L33_01005, partial [Rhododendron williamsianum]